jgi:hypothetical protein
MLDIDNPIDTNAARTLDKSDIMKKLCRLFPLGLCFYYDISINDWKTVFIPRKYVGILPH